MHALIPQSSRFWACTVPARRCFFRRQYASPVLALAVIPNYRDNDRLACPRAVRACPNSGSVEANLTAADVNPVNDPEPVIAQGIGVADFAGLLGAIEHTDSYGNVHADKFAAGEIRA